jgi:signal transduction histidine kinase
VYKKFIIGISAIVFTVATVVCLGWLLKIDSVLSLSASYESMKFNTALLFILSSIALFSQTQGQIKAAKLLAIIIATTGLATFLQYIFEKDFLIDQLFVNDYLTDKKAWGYPGRMNPISAINFVLFGIAIIAQTYSEKKLKLVVQTSLQLIMMFSLAAIVGYFLNIIKIEETGYTIIALHTAILFLLLCTGLDMQEPEQGMTAAFFNKYAGSTMARKIIIPYIFILLTTSVLVINLLRNHIINVNYGIGLLTITLLFAGIRLITYAANSVNTLEEKRKQAEEKVIRKAEELHNMMAGIRDGFFAVDHALNFILVSPVFAHMAKMQVDFMIGKNLLELFPFMEGGELVQKYQKALDSSVPSKFLHANSLNPNQIFEISVHPNENGLFVFFRDITEAKVAEREINELNNSLRLINQQLESKVELRTAELNRTNKNLESLTEKLNEQNTKLKNYIHIVSHNLRSHSVNLNYLVRYLKEDNDKETHVSLMKNLEDVIKNLTETLDTLVETVKIQDNHTVESAYIKFEETLKTIKTILLNDIEKNNASINSNFEEAPKVFYPKAYLESILLNLISNSLRYKSNNRTPNIMVKSYLGKEGIYLEISDNGLGMDLTRYGDKLFGLNKTFHRHPEAKGVGLFMVKNQVEAMGGKITVLSEVEKGTTFIIFLTSHS